MTTPLTVSQLAAAIGGTPLGDPSRLIRACATLENAGPDHVSFVSNQKYSHLLETTKAGCVILAPGAVARLQRADPLTVIEAKDPYFAWREALVKLHGHRRHATPGISPSPPSTPPPASARTSTSTPTPPSPKTSSSATTPISTPTSPSWPTPASAATASSIPTSPSTTTASSATAASSTPAPSSAPTATASPPTPANHHKIPQLGNVILENDVEIGANTVIERAVLDSTVIGTGTKIGNSVVIGHNCIIGPHNLLVSQVGIAGSTTTGKYVVLAGQVGVAGHLHIADFTRVAAQSGVGQDIADPNLEYGGYPAMEMKHARRVYLQLTQLPELAKRIKELERQLAKLQPPAPIEKK